MLKKPDGEPATIAGTTVQLNTGAAQSPGLWIRGGEERYVRDDITLCFSCRV